jgi:hypothetical protein
LTPKKIKKKYSFDAAHSSNKGDIIEDEEAILYEDEENEKTSEDEDYDLKDLEEFVQISG